MSFPQIKTRRPSALHSFVGPSWKIQEGSGDPVRRLGAVPCSQNLLF